MRQTCHRAQLKFQRANPQNRQKVPLASQAGVYKSCMHLTLKKPATIYLFCFLLKQSCIYFAFKEKLNFFPLSSYREKNASAIIENELCLFYAAWPNTT